MVGRHETVRRAGIARGGEDGLALRVGLRRPGFECQQLGVRRLQFAVTVADTDHGRQVLIDGVLEGVYYVG